MKIIYTTPALVDLDAILNYISTNSPQGAKRVQARIRAAIDLLADHPHIGARTDDQAIRRLPTLPYPHVVFYEVTERAYRDSCHPAYRARYPRDARLIPAVIEHNARPKGQVCAGDPQD